MIDIGNMIVLYVNIGLVESLLFKAPSNLIREAVKKDFLDE